MLGGIDGLSVASVVNAPDRATLLKTQDRRTRQNFGFCFPMLPPALIGITSGPARHSLPHFVFPASAVEKQMPHGHQSPDTASSGVRSVSSVNLALSRGQKCDYD